MTQPEVKYGPVELKRTEIEPGVFVIEVDRVYKISSVAALMDCTIATVNKFCKNGDLEFMETRLGKRITQGALKAFLTTLYTTPRVGNRDTSAALAARGIKKDQS